MCTDFERKKHLKIFAYDFGGKFVGESVPFRMFAGIVPTPYEVEGEDEKELTYKLYVEKLVRKYSDENIFL